MTFHNLGSINIDLLFRVPHIAAPGETILSHSLTRGLGGKGANASVALAKAGAGVLHHGAIGEDGAWVLNALSGYGVDCKYVQTLDEPTGQAIIQVDDAGENAITLLRGANWSFEPSLVDVILEAAKEGDWLVVQNETAHVPFAAQCAKDAGLRVAYAAAPFDADATRSVLPFVDLLALNHIEAAQLSASSGTAIEQLQPHMILVTKGADGATLYEKTKQPVHQPAFNVPSVVDTTAAGDTFFGFFLAALDNKIAIQDCLSFASAAAALTVTKPGAAEAIPDRNAVTTFLSSV